MRNGAVAAIALFCLGSIFACHTGEQAVKGVAKSAVNAEHKAQATATEREKERATLEQIPVPTKSLYVDVHDPSQWQNPFLTVGPNMLDLRIILPDEPLGSFAEGSMLRPPGARRQELQVRLSDLGRAVSAIPSGAWHYGRVIAVAESPEASRKDRPQIRRNLETVINQLNDLGVVVEEWPGR
ncbi:MAG TPA: hypothetical protein VGS10_23840 [Terracidiphilus sp.]|nr:hypothetical protein [Terracidiphilus sp.]